jgi:hypothetical protein
MDPLVDADHRGDQHEGQQQLRWPDDKAHSVRSADSERQGEDEKASEEQKNSGSPQQPGVPPAGLPFQIGYLRLVRGRHLISRRR